LRGGGSRLCHPQEMGTWCPQGTGARREGADQHRNNSGSHRASAPAAGGLHTGRTPGGHSARSAQRLFPLAPDPSPAAARPTASSGDPSCSQGTTDTHGRPGASLACGSAAASSPPAFSSGDGRAPPRSSSPLLPPAWPALSVHLSRRAPLTHGLPSSPWHEQGWRPLGWDTPIPPALGVPWHRSPTSALLQGRARGTPSLPEPSCPLRAAWATGVGWQRPSRVPC